MKSVCVARLGGIGDNIVASSVLPQFKKLGYHTEIICQRPFHYVFENNPFLDKLSPKDNGDLPQDPLAWQGWFQDRAKENDRFYNLSHSMEHLLALIPEQCAFWWPAPFRRKLCDYSYLEVAHDICEVPHEYAPNFFPTDAEFVDALETKAKIGERAIGWVIAGSRIDKIHPHSAAIIGRLIKELNAPVVMFGVPTEREKTSAQTITDHVRRANGSTEGLHLAMSPGPDHPSWPLRRSLALLQQCDLAIGPDTGPMWAVAMRAMPKIMMLGHASAKNITTGWVNTVTLHGDPRRVDCWPCHRLHLSPATCRIDESNSAAACIADISVERIVSEAKQVWDQQHDGTAAKSVGEFIRDNGRRAPRGRNKTDEVRRPGNGKGGGVPLETDR